MMDEADVLGWVVKNSRTWRALGASYNPLSNLPTFLLAGPNSCLSSAQHTTISQLRLHCPKYERLICTRSSGTPSTCSSTDTCLVRCNHCAMLRSAKSAKGEKYVAGRGAQDVGVFRRLSFLGCCKPE